MERPAGDAQAFERGSLLMESTGARPQIETERLILRPWRLTDADALFTYAQDPEVGPIAGWPTHTSIENSRQIIAEVLAVPENYAITVKKHKPTDEPVGSIGLMIGDQSCLDIPDTEAEIGYWIARPFWGNGYIPEAMDAIIRHAFCDLNLSAIWCGWDEGNHKSRRVQEKSGMWTHHTYYQRSRSLMGDTKTTHITTLTREQWLDAQKSDPSDTAAVTRQQAESISINQSIKLIARIRSGGQTGADRGALDAARETGIPICGWCPKGGLAEDLPDPPGVLGTYPELNETPSSGYVQRTAWNVRDSHATIVIAPDGLEPDGGTAMTVTFAYAYGRPVSVISTPDEVADALEWLKGNGGYGLTLNVAGPRRSKLPEVYEIAKDIVSRIITEGNDSR